MTEQLDELDNFVEKCADAGIDACRLISMLIKEQEDIEHESTISKMSDSGGA